MHINQELGRFGENQACQYLVQNNYAIIERNFRCKQGEIDIIAKDISKKELVFVEVKTRTSFYFGRPAEAVNTYKKKHIISASKYYIYKNSIKNTFVRFDVIEVLVMPHSFKIEHLKQII